MEKRGLSLSIRFGAPVLAVVGFVLLTFSLGAVYYDMALLEREYERKLDYIAGIAQASLPSAIWNLDEGAVADIVDALMLEGDVVFLNVFSDSQAIATEVHPDYFNKVHLFFNPDSNFKQREIEISYKGEKVGQVKIVLSTHRKGERLKTDAMAIFVLSALLFLAVIAAIYLTSRKFIFSPLSALEASATEITKGNLETAVVVTYEDEIGRLASSLDIMRQSIARLFEELNEANLKLTDYNQTLERRVAERTQELVELNELKNKFLGMAAHDLRNPLTSIRGMSELIINLDLEEEKKSEFISSISRVSEQMLNLLNDLLDVSAIESGNFDLKLEDCDVEELVRSRTDLVQFNATAKGIEFTLETKSIPPTQLDHQRISQVIDNLLTNAVKFSPPDSNVEVSVSCDQKFVYIGVRDFGLGIPEDEQDRLFQPFEKLSVQATAGEKSTGLGLAIVKKIVMAHHGQIEVVSQVGEGATFKVSLPTNLAEILAEGRKSTEENSTGEHEA